MEKRSFVSIQFHSDRIQIAKLNSKKDEVEKLATYQIPEGLIKDHKISDRKALSEIIKKIWKDAKLREKSIGLVVPEFSTFSKIVDVPSLNHDEITEAVSWQAKEFLPEEGADMVSDWQVVERSENQVKVLVVAIPKFVLAGYIDAVDDADLLPLVVETPSLSLVRASGLGNKGKLIIYVENNENIIVVSKDRAIIGSTLVSSKDPDETLHTAARIVKHFKEEKIEEVYLGGQITQDFVNGVQSVIGIKPVLITSGIKGLSKGDLENYLIPLSLQLKNTAEPENENTINLLPPAWVKHYKDKLADIRIWTLSLIASVALWAIFLLVVGTFAYFNLRARDLESKVTESSNAFSDEVVKEIGQVNKLTQGVLAITKKTYSPQEIINQLETLKPFGITVNSYTLTLDDGTVNVKGVAQDRSTLILFKQALEESEAFSAPALPITSLVQEQQINFDLTFSYLTIKSNQGPAPIKLNI